MALPDPITRKEMYLNKAATGEGNVPAEPITREEMYLNAIASGGGSGGGGAVPQPSDADPAPVGETANPGVSDDYARADHIHAPGLQFTPLILTMVPTSQSSPLVGTWTGATWEEVQAALMSGRDIVASIPGFSYVKINSAAKTSAADDWELSALFIYSVQNTKVLIQSVLQNSGTYDSNVFTLTPMS